MAEEEVPTATHRGDFCYWFAAGAATAGWRYNLLAWVASSCRVWRGSGLTAGATEH